MSDHKFQVNQIVKLWRYNHEPIPMRVSKVTPTGRVKLAYLTTGQAYNETFDSEGRVKGSGYGSISPLKVGETAEGIFAHNAHLEKMKELEREKKREAQNQKVKTWWESTGKTWWEGRVNAGTLKGRDLFIVRFNEENSSSERVALLTVRETKNVFKDNAIEYELDSGGMHGRGLPTHDYVNGYTCSTIRAATMEEALYNLTH